MSQIDSYLRATLLLDHSSFNMIRKWTFSKFNLKNLVFLLWVNKSNFYTKQFIEKQILNKNNIFGLLKILDKKLFFFWG